MATNLSPLFLLFTKEQTARTVVFSNRHNQNLWEPLILRGAIFFRIVRELSNERIGEAFVNGALRVGDKIVKMAISYRYARLSEIKNNSTRFDGFNFNSR